MGQKTLEEVRDGLGDSPKCPGRVRDHLGGLGRVGGHSGRAKTGRRTIREVWDGLGYPRGGPIWVRGPCRRFRTGRGNHGKVQDRSLEPWKVRDGSWDPREVRDGSGDNPRCLGRVGGPSVRYRTGRGTIREARDGSGDPGEGPGWVVGPSRRSWMG